MAAINFEMFHYKKPSTLKMIKISKSILNNFEYRLIETNLTKDSYVYSLE